MGVSNVEVRNFIARNLTDFVKCWVNRVRCCTRRKLVDHETPYFAFMPRNGKSHTEVSGQGGNVEQEKDTGNLGKAAASHLSG